MLSVCLCCLAQPGVEAEVDGREAGLAQQVHRVADVELAWPEHVWLQRGHLGLQRGHMWLYCVHAGLHAAYMLPITRP